MTWNGSGTYSPPASSFPEVAGTTIEAARFNNTITDIAAGITAALAKNGENAATANLPMGGYKHTGAAAGTANGEYVVFGTAATLQTILPAADATYALGSTSYTWTNVFGATFSAGTNKTLVSSSSAESRFGAGSAWTTSAWYANNAARISIASTGAVSIAAPSGGYTLSLAGATPLNLSDSGAAVNFTNTGASPVQLNYYGSDALELVPRHASASTKLYRGNGTLAITVGSAGNVTIAAADSGTELTVTGDITATSGTVTATTFSGTLSGSVSGATTVGASGNITTSGGDLVATAGNVTASSGTVSGSTVSGTTVSATNLNVNGTGGNISSGAWSPTAGLGANVTDVSSITGWYLRIGSYVYFNATVAITTSGTGTCLYTLTLPIASNFGAGSDASGTHICVGTSPATAGYVVADSGSDKLYCYIYLGSTVSPGYCYIQGSYKII